jgi:uncharacterized protein (TIGR02996 family)
MTTHEGFLQAILETPDDEAPRLIYADWLEDNGDPRRAEFIRLQCRLAATDESDPDRLDLLDRERELLTVYRQRWLPAQPDVLAKRLWANDFVRGFFARLHLPATALLEHGEQLFHTYPVEELHVQDAGGHLTDLARRPWLAGVSSLDLSQTVLTPDDLQALFASPYLDRLRNLNLRSAGLTAEGVEQLIRWPRLRQLASFSVANHNFGRDKAHLANQIGPEWWQRLLASPHLERLTSLTLNEPLAVADLHRIVHASGLASLTHLHLNYCKIPAEGWRVLGLTQGLPALEHLTVNGMDDEGCASLAGSPLLARLDTLRTNFTDFGSLGATALAASPYLARLRCLELIQCKVGPEEAKALASARFGSLAELSLFSCKIGPEGMQALAHSPYLAGLTRLDLMQNYFGDKGIQALVSGSAFRRLRALDLGGNSFGLEGARMLADAEVLSSLRHLSLTNNNFGARGVRALMQSPHLSGLWSLGSDDTFTDATARQVAASTTLGQLRFLALGDFRKQGFTEEGKRVLAASPRLPRLLQLHGGSNRIWESGGPVSPVVLAQGKGLDL